jgi:hypothetical protein
MGACSFHRQLHDTASDNNDNTPGLLRREQSPDSLAVDLRARNAPVICREKALLRLHYDAAHYEHEPFISESK